MNRVEKHKTVSNTYNKKHFVQTLIKSAIRKQSKDNATINNKYSLVCSKKSLNSNSETQCKSANKMHIRGLPKH